ncbi:MAG TPA: hypothetical protein VN667_15055 [Burkholderiales bacterium]|nr:hypothetical protein [Burkholderiales bacterium]
MKTTIEISDPLLQRARKLAVRRGVTLRALVERGLQSVLAENTESSPFRLRKASFGGKGLQPAVRGAGWDELRERAYEGRGGV